MRNREIALILIPWLLIGCGGEDPIDAFAIINVSVNTPDVSFTTQGQTICTLKAADEFCEIPVPGPAAYRVHAEKTEHPPTAIWKFAPNPAAVEVVEQGKEYALEWGEHQFGNTPEGLYWSVGSVRYLEFNTLEVEGKLLVTCDLFYFPVYLTGQTFSGDYPKHEGVIKKLEGKISEDGCVISLRTLDPGRVSEPGWKEYPAKKCE